MTDFIVSVEEAKDHLNITGTASDDELAEMCAAATAFVERHCGPVVAQTVTETVIPANSGLILLSAPVISVTSMVAALGYPSTFTVADWYADGHTIVAGYGATTSYSSWPVTVTYEGGYETVPADLRQATLDYIKWRWQSQRGATPLPAPGEEFAMAPTATVPYKVMEVIDGYRLPAIA